MQRRVLLASIHQSNVAYLRVWSAVALVVQIAVYFVIRIPVPNLSAKIAAAEKASPCKMS